MILFVTEIIVSRKTFSQFAIKAGKKREGVVRIPNDSTDKTLQFPFSKKPSVRIPACLEQRPSIVSAQQAITSIRRACSPRPGSIHSDSEFDMFGTGTGTNTTMSAMSMHNNPEEKVRIGQQNITVSILQGPTNHAIWKSRLLAALNAEDEILFAVATGEWKLDENAIQEGEEEALKCKRAHARCIPLITSTLPDSIYAIVMSQAMDAFKLMEALDTKFKPYPRYTAPQD